MFKVSTDKMTCGLYMSASVVPLIMMLPSEVTPPRRCQDNHFAMSSAEEAIAPAGSHG